MKRALLLSIALLGCPSSDDNSDTAAMDTTGTATLGSATVMPPPQTSSSSSMDSGSDTADTSSTGTDDSTGSESSSGGPCFDNQDCEEGEACGFEGQCVFATLLDYRVEITSWEPADCGTFFTPDLYVEVWRDENYVVETMTDVHSECPTSWSSFCLPSLLGPGVSSSRAVFALRNADVGDDPLVDYVCWPSPTDPEADCGDVSADVLHDGFYMGGTSQDGHVSITFTPGC